MSKLFTTSAQSDSSDHCPLVENSSVSLPKPKCAGNCDIPCAQEGEESQTLDVLFHGVKCCQHFCNHLESTANVLWLSNSILGELGNYSEKKISPNNKRYLLWSPITTWTLLSHSSHRIILSLCITVSDLHAVGIFKAWPRPYLFLNPKP